MIILGLDPGTSLIGYGVVRATGNNFELIKYGCITTPPHTPPEVGLPSIYKELCAHIKTHKPDVIGIENLFYTSNQKTVIGVSQARGVLILAAGQANIPVHTYSPPQIKLAVTGYGKAEKLQVQKMVARILKLDEIPKPDDAADALAVAICASQGTTPQQQTKNPV